MERTRPTPRPGWQALAEQVTRVCTEVMNNRYPFTKASTRDVPLADFARLFAPGQIMDKFYKERLEPFVDTSKPQWNWRVDSRVARALSLVIASQLIAGLVFDAFGFFGAEISALKLLGVALILVGGFLVVRF